LFTTEGGYSQSFSEFLVYENATDLQDAQRRRWLLLIIWILVIPEDTRKIDTSLHWAEYKIQNERQFLT